MTQPTTTPKARAIRTLATACKAHGISASWLTARIIAARQGERPMPEEARYSA